MICSFLADRRKKSTLWRDSSLGPDKTLERDIMSCEFDLHCDVEWPLSDQVNAELPLSDWQQLTRCFFNHTGPARKTPGRHIVIGACHCLASTVRIVVPGVPHHVTPRGKHRQQVFCADAAGGTVRIEQRPRSYSQGRRRAGAGGTSAGAGGGLACLPDKRRPGRRFRDATGPSATTPSSANWNVRPAAP